MELTGELKDKLAKCATREEAKEQLKDAGLILSDEELDSVAGGVDFEQMRMKEYSEHIHTGKPLFM